MAQTRDPDQQVVVRDDMQVDDTNGPAATTDAEVTATFEAMGLKDDLLRGIFAFGLERPSAIQQRAIRPIVQGRDVIAQSPSGTGVTTAVAIGVLQV